MEQQQIPTKEIKTTGGHTVVFREYITGRQKRDITNVFLKDMEMHQKGGEAEFSGIKGSVTNEAEDAAIKAAVVSVDGQTENLVDAILNLPVDDYDEVIVAVNEITGGKKKLEKSS